MKEIAQYQISLKAILRNSKGEVLLLKTVGKVSYGDYDFPGGRIDADEFEVPYFDILAREIREEFGDNFKYEIKNKVVSYGRFRSSRETVFYVVFEGIILDENIKISEDHAGFKFVKLEEIALEDYFKGGMLEVSKTYLGR